MSTNALATDGEGRAFGRSRTAQPEGFTASLRSDASAHTRCSKCHSHPMAKGFSLLVQRPLELLGRQAVVLRDSATL